MWNGAALVSFTVNFEQIQQNINILTSKHLPVQNEQ